MKIYEYKTEWITHDPLSSHDIFTEKMNVLGSKGWNAYHIVNVSDKETKIYFKREKDVTTLEDFINKRML